MNRTLLDLRFNKRRSHSLFAYRPAFIAPVLGCLAFTACSSEPAQTLPTIEVSTQPSLPRTSSAQAGPTSAASSVSNLGNTSSSADVGARTLTATASTKTDSQGSTSTGSSSDNPSGTTSSSTGSSSASSTHTSTSQSSDNTGSNTGSSTATGTDSGTETPEDPTCLPLCEKGSQDAFVDCVVEFKPAPETAHYSETFEKTDPKTGETVVETRDYYGWNHDKMPDVVLGPPKGSFDTVSLGCEGSLTVGFVDPPLTDGPGADLIVFENPFAPSFPEPLKVEVSDDACTWHEFPCNPVTLQGCGGISVVKALPKSGIDPTDPKVAGGDAFDLADIGVARARFVRVTSVSREYWLAKEQTEKWCDPSPMTTGKGGSDVDAFAFVHTAAVGTNE